MGKDSSVVIAQPSDIRAKGLLHALSEIQQFSAVEYRTSLPEGVVPIQPRMSFWSLAGKEAFVLTFYTFVTAPFSFAVFDKILPVFGSYNPDITDKIFSYLLSAAPTLALTMLIMFILTTRTYLGKTTENIVTHFLLSYIVVKLTVTLILAMTFMLIYERQLMEKFFIEECVKLVKSRFISPETKLLVYKFVDWLLEFREIIPKAIKFSVALHVGVAVVLYCSFLRAKYNAKKLARLRREWE